MGTPGKHRPKRESRTGRGWRQIHEPVTVQLCRLHRPIRLRSAPSSSSGKALSSFMNGFGFALPNPPTLTIQQAEERARRSEVAVVREPEEKKIELKDSQAARGFPQACRRKAQGSSPLRGSVNTECSFQGAKLSPLRFWAAPP